MTVKQLIETLQSIPDSLKDCDIEMYQYANVTDRTSDISEISATVVIDWQEEEMSIEEAENASGYKYIVLM